MALRLGEYEYCNFSTHGVDVLGNAYRLIQGHPQHHYIDPLAHLFQFNVELFRTAHFVNKDIFAYLIGDNVARVSIHI